MPEKTLSYQCKKCHAEQQLSGAAAGSVVPCTHCSAPMAIPASAPPVILQLALHAGDITKEGLSEIMRLWEEKRAENPHTEILEVLKDQPGITEEKINKLKKTHKVWLLRSREKRLAAAILRLGWVSEEKIKQATDIQQLIFRKKGVHPGLGDVLIQQGHLKKAQLDAILKAMNKCDEPAAKAPPETKKTPPKDPEGDPVCHASAPDGIPCYTMEQDETSPSELDSYLSLTVSKDNMAAFIREKEPLPPHLTTDELLDWIQAKGIIYGLVDQNLLDGFIRFESVRQSSFKTASGKPPRPGKEGRIQFHFPTDFLSSGAMLTDDGRIDFRERGAIPHVTKGSLLAEKTATIHGVNGVDVFGNIQVVPEVKDPPLKAGTGVYTSEDRLKIFAKIDGQPSLRASGEVSVIDEILIKGDVGYETGHIQYEGKVRITGKIPAGFRVEANEVTAEAVDGGQISAKGDVVITNGITEGEVYTEGEVRAKFVNKSKIRTLSNVTIHSEVIDSDIACSGGFNIRSGKIIASEIAARQGIEAGTIGTEISSSSTLHIGIDLPLQETFMEIDRKIQKKKDILSKVLLLPQELENEEKKLLADITHFAQVQDRSGLKLKLIQEKKFDEAETTAAEAPSLVKKLHEDMQEAEKRLGELFNRQDTIDDDKKKAREAIDAAEKNLKEDEQEKKAMEDWAAQRTPIALLKINSKAYPGTRIVGSKAQATLQEPLSKCMVRQVEVQDTGEKEYIIRIFR
ncbi:hypothetical protein LZ24_01279 [Desulfobotulus alkaliphilus]|uniref:Flagellar Assembly Protein A N-terminal region domain-containing protein n=1 Tax=Desulfobotulus alkaliphilus TaxID=622671 RepID=A0A562RVV2_9BACT|nr:FapA family protein [Desulfobotulus alkaliphilus]TWI73192.1 hypothetical protein LZ24_01279 [Desulfobotulus alkaliphilus]